MLRTPQPYLVFADAVGLFTVPPHRPAPGVDRQTAIADTVQLGADVSIGPFVSVGSGSRIGARTIIHPNVCIGADVEIGDECLVCSHVAIRDGSRIGARVILQNGAVIGSDGFGFAKRPDGTHQKIPQTGIVVIEDDVEIGANAAVDRPAIGETRVRAGAKIDNLVQVAHSVTVGRNALLASQVGIAGSTTIEDDVVLAGQVGVSGHLTIGKGAVATAQTGIPNSVDAGAQVSGYPALDNLEWRKASAVFRKLPALSKTMTRLEQRVADLERQQRPSTEPDR